MAVDLKKCTDSILHLPSRTSLHARSGAQDGEKGKVTLRINREERHARGAGHYLLANNNYSSRRNSGSAMKTTSVPLGPRALASK